MTPPCDHRQKWKSSPSLTLPLPAEMSRRKSPQAHSQKLDASRRPALTNSITSEQEADAAQRALSKNFGYVHTDSEVGRSGSLIGSLRHSVGHIWAGTSSNSGGEFQSY